MSKVLIIEDDPLMSRMYLRVFTYEGLDVQVAENGQAGLEALKNFRPDIILLDIMMPVMNGVDTLAALKNNPATKDIPVIMLTNLSDLHTAEDTVKQGALQYIIKSKYSPTDVVVMIKDIINKGGTTKNEN